MDILIRRNDKRGMSVGDIYPVMLTIALVAILIAITLFVLASMNTQMAIDTFRTTNESGWVNETLYYLDNVSSQCEANTPALVQVVNGTDGVVIALANVTFDTTTWTLTNATSRVWNDTRITYTWRAGGDACEATNTIITQISDFVPWIGIILLVIAAAIVIGILIRNLAGGSRV